CTSGTVQRLAMLPPVLRNATITPETVYVPQASRLPWCLRSTSNVQSVLIIQTVPSEFVHVPTSADRPDCGYVAKAFSSRNRTPAKTIRREDCIFMPSILSAAPKLF